MTQTTAHAPGLSRGGVPTLRRKRPYGQWLLACLVLLAVGGLLYSLYTNENLNVPEIRRYLFSPPILRGVLVTLALTAIAFVTGVLLGLVVAVMRLSSNKVLAVIAGVYIWIFRSIPPIVQLIFWGFFAALYPRIALGIPGTTFEFFDVDTNAVLSPFMAAVIGLLVIETAYAAEVIRAGIQSVEHGQTQAARALALRSGQILRMVVLPQAMPAIIPPMGNNLINLVKATSLVSVIGGAELMTAVQHIYGQNYQVIPLLAVASLWYLALTSILTVIQMRIEAYYNRSARAVQGTQPTKPVDL